MYAVVWVTSTLDDLRNIRASLDLDDAALETVTASLQEIAARLRANPLEEGESRNADERISFVAPLGFTFRVTAEERMVTVLNLWRYK